MTNNKGMISVTIDGKTKKVPAGARLSEILELDMPCGGHGKCGKCRVKVSGDISLPTESEIKLLGEESIALGTRLSCLTYARGNCTIITDITKNDDTFRQIVSSGDMPDFDFAPIFTKYGAAIDIGTTTLAARLYDTNGNLVSEKSR